MTFTDYSSLRRSRHRIQIFDDALIHLFQDDFKYRFSAECSLYFALVEADAFIARTDILSLVLQVEDFPWIEDVIGVKSFLYFPHDLKQCRACLSIEVSLLVKAYAMLS